MLIGQVVVYFSVNEVFCEVSAFSEKMGCREGTGHEQAERSGQQ